MPDATLKTISATQAPALWNVSPYYTRWMLHKHFAEAMPIDTDEPDGRMLWGKKLQPLVLAQAGADLALEVVPNADDTYIRRGFLGCTRDAEIIIPDQGPAALETKCVFDYGVWMRDWDGGRHVPRHYEIQLQVQMFVGNGEKSFDRGTLAAWVCGDMYYFDREPIPDLWNALESEAMQFFIALKKGEAPDPFGSPIELPFLTALDRQPGKVVDLASGENAIDIAEKVRSYAIEQKNIRQSEKSAKELKAQLLALMGDAPEAECFGGIKLRVANSGRGVTLKPFIPDVLPDALMHTVKHAADIGA